MRIWAIGDLHLSFGVANKEMDVFGPQWKDHAKKIASNWKSVIHKDDLILIPGDLSWALKLEEAIPDLQWVHELPGTKVLIKGNHDYWWDSLRKIAAVLPPSIHLIQNNAFHWRDTAIGGARLWDTPEFSYSSVINFQENVQAIEKEELIQQEMSEKIFNRELERLKMSIKCMDPNAKHRIVMTHYPPIGPEMKPSRAAQILEENQISLCVFGHLHNLKNDIHLFGTARGVKYMQVACDYIHYNPVLAL